MRLALLDRIREASTIEGRRWHRHPGPLGDALEIAEHERDADAFFYGPGVTPLSVPKVRRTLVEWRRFGVTLAISGHAARASRIDPEEIIERQADDFARDVAELLDCYYPGDLYVGGEHLASEATCLDESRFRYTLAVAGKEHPEIEAVSIVIHIEAPPLWDRFVNWLRRLVKRPERWGPDVFVARRVEQ